MKPDSLVDYRFERITELDLSTMELLFDEALCVRSSSKVLFFRQIWDYEFEIYQWELYYSLKIKGSIYYIRGNQRIQITNDNYIYVYLIDPDTYEPILESVMINNMMCSQMMTGAKKRCAISYK